MSREERIKARLKDREERFQDIKNNRIPEARGGRRGLWYIIGKVDMKTVFLGGEVSESSAFDVGRSRGFDNDIFTFPGALPQAHI